MEMYGLSTNHDENLQIDRERRVAYQQPGLLDRSLTDVEVEEFQAYAREHDPPSMAQWAIYHPVCREVWVARGISPIELGGEG